MITHIRSATEAVDCHVLPIRSNQDNLVISIIKPKEEITMVAFTEVLVKEKGTGELKFLPCKQKYKRDNKKKRKITFMNPDENSNIQAHNLVEASRQVLRVRHLEREVQEFRADMGVTKTQLAFYNEQSCTKTPIYRLVFGMMNEAGEISVERHHFVQIDRGNNDAKVADIHKNLSILIRLPAGTNDVKGFINEKLNNVPSEEVVQKELFGTDHTFRPRPIKPNLIIKTRKPKDEVYKKRKHEEPAHLEATPNKKQRHDHHNVRQSSPIVFLPTPIERISNIANDYEFWSVEPNSQTSTCEPSYSLEWVVSDWTGREGTVPDLTAENEDNEKFVEGHLSRNVTSDRLF
ncbi:3-dehydroquinate dehydratase [Acrasis kona]|uniref:3-dehydroquinate dehydratase n=1 Tax=Acrasis kona TaxID=1008807 RepID=A0AAW2YM43_9EUKA